MFIHLVMPEFLWSFNHHPLLLSPPMQIVWVYIVLQQFFIVPFFLNASLVISAVEIPGQ